MIIKIVFLFVLVGISESEIICPKQSWTPLKNVTEEGSWSFSIPTHYGTSKTMVQVKMCKTMRYRCANNDAVELSASQVFRYRRQDQGNVKQKFNLTTNVRTCKLNCNNVTNRIGFCNVECVSDVEVPLTVEVRTRRSISRGGNREWGQWEETGQFTYFYKNCNKLHWSSWTETSNCTSSIQTTFARSCMDCDGDGVQEKYCEGNFTKHTKCQPLWGPWGEAGPCKVSLCNSTGERVRSRLCLYADGSESPDPQLCSNQSTIIKEQCTENAKQQAETRGQPDNPRLYIYIGITVLLALVLVPGLAAVRWCRRQKTQIHNESHRDSFVVDQTAADPTQLQFQLRSNEYNCDQVDLRESTALCECTYEQLPGPSNEYVMMQPCASNVYNFAEQVEPNVYEFM